MSNFQMFLSEHMVAIVTGSLFGFALLMLNFVQLGDEHFLRSRFVLRLRSFILAGRDNACRDVC